MLKYLILCLSAFLYPSPSIVFVHLGPKLPAYLSDAVAQARAFNDCPIYVIANETALSNLPQDLGDAGAICVAAESLPCQPLHETFCKTTRLDRVSRGGFWMYATERFFYLYELMLAYDLSDCFHLETDNALYADVRALLPTFRKYYRDKIGATFDNDRRCIAGFIYVSDPIPLQRFLQFVLAKVRTSNNDMEFLAQFKSVEGGKFIEELPIIPPSYAADHLLISAHGHRASDPKTYSNHFDAFQSVFDAAAIGQYLGGIDPRNGPSSPGFINESCVFNPAHFQFDWIPDELGRFIPMIVYRNTRWPIVNLHIHCKNLESFKSRKI